MSHIWLWSDWKWVHFCAFLSPTGTCGLGMYSNNDSWNADAYLCPQWSYSYHMTISKSAPVQPPFGQPPSYSWCTPNCILYSDLSIWKMSFFFSILYLMYCKVGRSFPASLTSLHSTRQRWFANPTNIPKEPKNQTNSQHTTLGHWRGGLAKLPAGPAHKYSPSVHKYLPLGVNLFIFSAINNRPQLWSRHEDFYADLDCSGFAW